MPKWDDDYVDKIRRKLLISDASKDECIMEQEYEEAAGHRDNSIVYREYIELISLYNTLNSYKGA